MTYAAPTPPILVRPELQRLSMQEVRGQKRRTRSEAFPSTTAILVAVFARKRKG